MKMIKCRKCGAEIDASKGECPYCGAIYYVIDEDQPDSDMPGSINETFSPDQWIKDNPDDEPTMTWQAQPDASDSDMRIYTPEQERPQPAPQQQPQRQQSQQPQYRQQSQTRPASGGTQQPRSGQGSDPVVSYFSMDDEDIDAPQRPQQPQPHPQQAQYRQQRPMQRPQPQYRQQPQPERQRTQAAAHPPQQRVPNQAAARRYAQEQARQEEYRREKKTFASTYIIMAVVIVLAMAAVILCLVNGAFDFNKNEKLYMPSVIGQNEEAARAILADMGLTVKTEDKTSSQPKGIVVDQSIKEKAKLTGKETVTLYISTGDGESGNKGDAPSQASDAPSQSTNAPETLKDVPNLKGKTYDAAKQELAAMGLRLEKSGDKYDDNVAEGLIIAQSPEGSTKIKDGGTVYVTLSKGPEPPPGYTITVTAGKGGKVSPHGLVTVEEGKSQTFTITPDDGYEIREVKVDGKSIGAVESYTFDNVTGDHTIYAIFQIAAPEPTPTPTPEPTPAPTETPAVTEPPASEPEQH